MFLPDLAGFEFTRRTLTTMRWPLHNPHHPHHTPHDLYDKGHRPHNGSLHIDHDLHAGGDRLGPDVQRRRLPRLFSSKHALWDQEGKDHLLDVEDHVALLDKKRPIFCCLFVDNMLLKGVCEKYSQSDSKTDHELSSLHRRRRGALSFYNHIDSFVSVIVNLVITSLVIVVEFTSFWRWCFSRCQTFRTALVD